MEDVKFKIDEEKKTVTPILPEIEINIATLDENSISYIPKNPDLSLKEVITKKMQSTKQILRINYMKQQRKIFSL